MTEQPDTEDQLAAYLEEHVPDNDRGGLSADAGYIAEAALNWLRDHPEIAAGLWPNGVEMYVEGKWVSPAGPEVIAKIRRLEAEAQQATLDAKHHYANAERRVKDLQAEFARQAGVLEKRATRAEAAVARARKLVEDIRTWASPDFGRVAQHYADTLTEVLDGPAPKDQT